MSPHRRQIIIATVVLSLVGIIFVWEGFIKDSVVPKKFGVVEKGQIYRSGQLSRWLVEKTLVKYNIKVIVGLSGDSADDLDKNAEKQAAAKLGIERQVFSLSGNGTGDINNYAKAIAMICRAKKEGKPVLVHCSAGAQRAGGVIAAYRLLIEKKDVPFTLREMKHYGWTPKDNPDLLPYLNSHMEELASMLKQMGVINSIPNSLPQITLAESKNIQDNKQYGQPENSRRPEK